MTEDEVVFDCLIGSESDLLQILELESSTGTPRRHLKGSRMGTSTSARGELSAALQFPLYCGDNWNAVDECLSDLEWLKAPHTGFILSIYEADRAFEKDPEVLGLFVKVLQSAVVAYGEPIELGEHWDRPPIPWRVILHTHHDAGDLARWTEAGAGLRPVNAEPRS